MCDSNAVQNNREFDFYVTNETEWVGPDGVAKPAMLVNGKSLCYLPLQSPVSSRDTFEPRTSSENHPADIWHGLQDNSQDLLSRLVRSTLTSPAARLYCSNMHRPPDLGSTEILTRSPKVNLKI